MPFVRGRYHINPIAGAALEAAREVDEALSTAEQSARKGGSASATSSVDGRPGENQAQGPIHRVEIEVAEVAPPHSGRAQRGFVARIHRASVATGGHGESSADRDFSDWPASGNAQSGRASTQTPETHVFADQQDLTDFLRSEFKKDHGR